MRQLETLCSWCGQPLIEIPIGRYYVRICDKLGCPLYRERQGSREKDIEFGPIIGFYPAPLMSPPPNNPLSLKRKINNKIKIKNKIKRKV